MPLIPPTNSAGLSGQALSLSAPAQNMQSQHFFPPLGLPYPYERPGPNSGQHCPANVGMSAPQLYYGAPAYPPFNQHSHADLWAYGHYPPGSYPHPFPHAGETQPTTPVQVNVTQVCTEVGLMQACAKVGPMQVCDKVGPMQAHVEVGSMQAINQPVPTVFQPKKDYPNKQLSEGGTLQFARAKDLLLTHLKSGCLMLISMRATRNAPS